VATWNVNSLKARLERVEAWLEECQPDILCMQETKLADSAFPALTFSALGYESVHHGEGRWNGVAILSRVGLDAPAVGFAPDDEIMADEARIVSATCAGIRVTSVYVPNGRSLDDEQYSTSSTGWRGCERISTRRVNRRHRWWCAATSTSHPKIETCGTRLRCTAPRM
jgi:exodeoxyribonuclease-3